MKRISISSLYRLVKDQWLRRRLVRWTGYGLFLFIIAQAALQVAIRVVPINYGRLFSDDVSSVITDRNGRFLRGYLSRDGRWRLPVNLDEVAPAFLQATIATEDKRFFRHGGIDWLAVVRAGIANLRSGRIESGASTITMQVAGFLIDDRDRTLSRKARQAFLALQLEYHLTKREILQCYLTHASYGGNICGVEAAARRYFNKTAGQLSPGEATLLAGLPQSPERFRPDRHIEAALKRREHVVDRLVDAEYISQAGAYRMLQVPVHVGSYAVPTLAPHFCDDVRQMFPGEFILRTSLDLDLQRMVERTFSYFCAKNRKAGISNGAAVVLHNQTGEVLALVGAADYWNKFDSGQVNGVMAFRSPGSILKPLIFASAMEYGLLSPGETLYDVPVSINGYTPLNYDRQFRGPVSAEQALALSLNIPAIEVLQRVGVARFKDILTDLGAPVQLSKHGDPGLSMAIGTCSVRLIDMVRAYASLATDGELRPVSFMPSQTTLQRTRWVDPGVAHSILTALSDGNVRAPEDVAAGLAGVDQVAWKTGTSNGHKDAWTIAVTEDYTVGIWIGNMDGRPNRNLVGSIAAAPAALTIAEKLRGQTADWPKDQNYYVEAELCQVSMLAAGERCSEVVRGPVLRDKPGKICSCHVVGEINPDTHYAICTRCSMGKAIHKTVSLSLPANVSSWLRTNAHPWATQLKPPHNPECEISRQGIAPAIISPPSGSEIIIVNELPLSQQKIELKAVTENPGEQLIWFLNGTLVGTCPAAQSVLLEAAPGRHQVMVTDMHGRTSESWFRVEHSDRVLKAGEIKRLSAISLANKKISGTE